MRVRGGRDGSRGDGEAAEHVCMDGNATGDVGTRGGWKRTRVRLLLCVEGNIYFGLLLVECGLKHSKPEGTAVCSAAIVECRESRSGCALRHVLARIVCCGSGNVEWCLWHT